MRVNDIKVTSVRRVKNNNDNSQIPGVVVASFQTEDEVKTILKNKSHLNKSVYRDIFVHPDQSKVERVTASNLRMIANAINKGGRVAVHGGKIVNCDTFGHNHPTSASSNTNQLPFSQRISQQDQPGRGQGQRGRRQGHRGRGQGQRGREQGYRGTQRGQGAWNNEQRRQ
ncbi:hypothetical protein DPMN_138791 [Dreissena polymorpha]|uniref:Uncharacterized protein n=1 Tax=Dreissena polymorpha TaxID=45954 RepID=A0A9D4G4H4_DREPO|nr:hypothetical protein DPMN_138791 [Dreissena polymorpha]